MSALSQRRIWTSAIRVGVKIGARGIAMMIADKSVGRYAKGGWHAMESGSNRWCVRG